MSLNNVEKEAMRRIDRAASIVESAIRLGGDPVYVVRAMRSAVSKGAEEHAADVVEDYERAERRIA